MRAVEIAPENLTENQWIQYFECREDIYRNANPEDPLPSRDQRRKYMLNPHPERMGFKIHRKELFMKYDIADIGLKLSSH
ncbi:MAG: hypothetical protein ACFFD3_04020 [Candidatus Thorarchaeota archaeon]